MPFSTPDYQAIRDAILRDIVNQLPGANTAGDGDYAIRVYIGRAAARRHEASDFRLTVTLRGKPLPALPMAHDARVAGTPYHATARIRCVPPFASAAAQCDAGVVRRGHDGTATVEVRGSADLRRRILFVQGRPTASDAMDAMTFSRRSIHSQRASLSTWSPVWPPNSSARSKRSSGTRCTASTSLPAATPDVWLALEMHTR